MEKISGILPSTARMTTNVKEEKPVRPGTPAFGRDEGSLEIRDRVSLSSVKNSAQNLEDLMPPIASRTTRDEKDAKHSQIVENLTNKFFMTKAQKPQIESQLEATDMPNAVQKRLR